MHIKVLKDAKDDKERADKQAQHKLAKVHVMESNHAFLFDLSQTVSSRCAVNSYKGFMHVNDHI